MSIKDNINCFVRKIATIQRSFPKFLTNKLSEQGGKKSQIIKRTCPTIRDLRVSAATSTREKEFC